MKNVIGEEKYFVHKGTWGNDYQWRIQKVVISGMKIDKDNKEYVEFSFNCCGYEYPYEYLKDTLEEAKEFAIRMINEEKQKQIEQITNYTVAPPRKSRSV